MNSNKYVDILREIRDQLGREMEHQNSAQRARLIRDKISTNPVLAELSAKAINPQDVRTGTPTSH